MTLDLDAPIFSFPVHVVYDSNVDPGLRDLMLARLQEIADAFKEVQSDVIEEQTDQVVFGDEPAS